jgi:hypothetical protein
MQRNIDKRRRRLQSGFGLLIVGALGALTGQLVVADHAAACSCAEPEWLVTLVSVTSSDGSVDHRAFWPTVAFLSSYEGHAHIWAEAHQPGVVARAGASTW